ncbi:response regulator [Paucidesulfovibrio longus]|uniref:response regulator n=1 Tax=Paucidesulfovibrio longus TaxID=889 RepID=UPI0003B463EB|nr:response regulator [Paucidesulfovibrio longus]
MPKSVLIVEDDPRSRRLVKDLVEAKGYQALEAVNGREGVDLARKSAPDLILMDIQMPVMDGLEAIRHIRETPGLDKTPIVVLTAFSMPTEEEEIRASGCDEYMSKPIDTRRLVKMFQDYLA